MDKLQRNVWLIVAIIFAVGVTVLTLSRIVTEPWHILPDIGGDGSKNNFTYLYHSMYGHGYWFEGMNYPYGEHIVFTDGQPLLSVLLTCFKNVTSGGALTVCWELLGLSYVLAIVFVYKILTHYKVAPLAAIIFSGLIVVCSPQVFCINGHYALGYTCLVPMLFYWTVLYHERALLKYCIYVFVTGIVMAFLHPYYLAVILVWSVAYAAGYIVLEKAKFSAKMKQVSPLVVTAVSIFLVVAVVMKTTDPSKDRPVSPYFETGMYTKLSHIFSSDYSPLWKNAIDMGIVPRASKGGEGFTYLGVVTIVTMLVAFLFFVINKMKKKQTDILAESGFSGVWLFISFAVLILAMGIPFIWKMEWLMDYFSVLKQFRTLGRFSWIFYNVITIYSAVILYSWYSGFVKKHKPVLGRVLLFLCMCIWGYEASGCIGFSRKLSDNGIYNYDLIFSKFGQSWESFLHDNKKDKNDFQGILLLPFFHVGTEKLWVGDPGWLITMGTSASLQLRLPIVDVMLSRSSWSVAERQVKIVGGPFTEKPMLKDIKSDKPFLILDIGTNALYADEQYLLSSSDYLGERDGMKIYAFYPARLVGNDKKMRDSVNAILPYVRVGDTCVGERGSLYVNHYDIDKNSYFFGDGAAKAVSEVNSVVTTIPVTPVNDSVLYEVSCWFLLGDKDPRSPYLTFLQLDKNGKTIASCDALTKSATDNDGMWFRAGRYFFLKPGCVAIKCLMVNDPSPSYKMMDELLLRPAASMVISKAADGSVMVNNHRFKVVKQ
jgi:hypothetical protein